jgi:hypothetical protein
VGLLGLTSYGSGFDQLTFTLTDDHSGTQLLSRTFTSLSAATAFFDDDTLSLFKLTRGVDITPNYQLTASQVSGAGISYEVGAVPTPEMDLPSTTSPSPIGKWSGQLQFQESENGKTVQAAHSVALSTAEFSADGKVTGASQEIGCRMLGIWGTGLGPRAFTVDLTLSGCAHADLNRRFHGSFILASPDSSGGLQLNAVGSPFTKDVAKSFDVEGTLRRQ